MVEELIIKIFQAIYRKVKSLGLQNLITSNDEAKRFFKSILALAYLPSRLITEQFQKLVDDLTPAITARFADFLAYYARYWLRTVRPEGFSVYGLGRRTNNIIESYHSRLGHRMEARPTPWDFICNYRFWYMIHHSSFHCEDFSISPDCGFLLSSSFQQSR